MVKIVLPQSPGEHEFHGFFQGIGRAFPTIATTGLSASKDLSAMLARRSDWGIPADGAKSMLDPRE
jgi:hypothetical protein